MEEEFLKTLLLNDDGDDVCPNCGELLDDCDCIDEEDIDNDFDE